MTRVRCGLVAMLLVVGNIGCGPLHQPLVVRLDEEGQREIDKAWRRIQEQPEEFDRVLLLDAAILLQLHQMGVDELTLSSTKKLDDGYAVMTIRYDRANPAVDKYSIVFHDRRGRVTRRERYARDQIEERIAFLYRAAEVKRSGQVPHEVERPFENRQEKRRQRFERLSKALDMKLEPADHGTLSIGQTQQASTKAQIMKPVE